MKILRTVLLGVLVAGDLVVFYLVAYVWFPGWFPGWNPSFEGPGEGARAVLGVFLFVLTWWVYWGINRLIARWPIASLSARIWLLKFRRRVQIRR